MRHRVVRVVERTLLGFAMGVLAFLVERRVTKSLRSKR
jgi:hypothetical protein